MTQINKDFIDLPNAQQSPATGDRHRQRWLGLCRRYLPIEEQGTIWRFSRQSKPEEPLQGWKLHVSATVLDACRLFEAIAPFLISLDVQFKAPSSLDELAKINCGLQYGYPLLGKFITVYPASEKQAVKVARRLHELTKEFTPVSVPFDEQYLPRSSVFYRYGAFVLVEMIDAGVGKIPAIRNSAGELVPDDRFQAVPDWLKNPFEECKKEFENDTAEKETPLTNTYKIFRAITQRGKGGTYQALDLSGKSPRLCIVKEGRRYGEIGWDNQDGYCLVKNEFRILSSLCRKNEDVPQVFSSFELEGDFYLVMEYIEGKNLKTLMNRRRRRLSIRQTAKLALGIAEIIEKIHGAGWVWNDCKPANLIVTENNKLRPVDFEGAYPINEAPLFDWKTKGFSKPPKASEKGCGKLDDFYALGAVVYFLLTGSFYDAEKKVPLTKLRRGVPPEFVEITEKLLSDSIAEISEIKNKFDEILKSV